MTRTKRSARLDTRSRRCELLVGSRSTETLAEGCYLLYHRPKNGASGTWGARWFALKGQGGQRQTRIGVADDFSDADGIRVLNYGQATKIAGLWFKEQARLEHLKATGEVISDKAYCVADAIADYRADIERRGRPTDTVDSFSRTRIVPLLGEIEVAKLTRGRVEKWFHDLASSPRMKTGKGTSEKVEKWESEPTKDQTRARRNTANRVLAILKRALNLAVEQGRYSGATPWRDVKPFQGVVVARARFLSRDEQVRLLNACPPDFRDLVAAALHTGSRFAPLTRLQVRDVNLEAGTIWIGKDKGKGHDTCRHVFLAPDAVEWFRAKIAGKQPDDLVLTRAGVKRVKREGEPNQWLPSDQLPFMKAACEAAKLEYLTFHELRHSYASTLVNVGVPLAYVAAQLGHANTRMVEKFYGHLAPSALAQAIRKLTPALKVPGEDTQKTIPLKIAGDQHQG